jgi:hypothetical protein
MTHTFAFARRLLTSAVAVTLSLAFALDARADHVDCSQSPWGCLIFGAWRAERGADPHERVTVLGDSLVQLQEDALAEQLASANLHAFTEGAGGAAYWHWNVGLVDHGLDIGDILTRDRAEHVILALGANDARVLASGRVTQSDVAAQIAWGMARADATTNGCIILVEPASHGNAPYNKAASEVRAILRFIAAARNNELGSTHFVTADWDAHARGHEDWFAGPEDIHHTEAGKAAYRSFITFVAAVARNGSFGC